ncbi:hypothetical protein PsAD13_02913 [Pseudovibrio sp. Ad13]|uniref:hypothetical protein n=1 Tax=Pseudovibrio sp. Ad13 TaxID=989396 RepID=UPI0007AEAB4F|nr:hypothetical protein [Pseudovibrio sp. Ad13]KZK82716.1 hypothetical protein PsAD13_02913 [Pseudovibrio sp. Ad13]
MPFQNFKRQGFFAVSITVLGLSAQPALSSPASDLIDKYNDWFLANGAEIATYAKAVEDGSKTEILDHKIEGMFTLSLDEDKPNLGVYYIIKTPKAIYDGSSRDGGTFSFQNVTTDEMQLELGFFEKAENFKNVAEAQASDDVIKVIADAKDYVISGYSVNWIDLPVLSDGVTTEEFQQLLAAATSVSYDRSSFAEVVADMAMADALTGTYTIKNGVYSGAENGVVALASIEGIEYKTTTSMTTGGREVSTVSETVYNDFSVKDQDVRPLLALLGAAKAPSDRLLSEYRVGSFSSTIKTEGASASEPFGFLEVSAGETTTKDVRMSGGDAAKLWAAFESLKDKPEEEEAVDQIFSMLDALGSYSVAYSDINDMVIKAWDPIRARMKDTQTPSFEASLKHASTTDLTTNSLGQVKLEGLHGAVEGDDAVFDLDSFELADLAWPSLRTMVESTLAAEADPAAAMKAIPTIGRISLAGLNMQAKDLPTPVSLGELTIEMGNHIGPIPTSLSEVIGGLSFDAALLQEPMVLGVLDRLGIERVNLTQDFKIAWDENTQDLSLEKFEFELENGIKLRADIQLGGIPRSLFENPQEAEAVVALATFKGAQIEVMDSPLISELLATQAEQAGLPAELLASMMIDGTLQQAGPLAETEFALELAKAAKSFAAKPTNIRVTLAPQTAVPIMQLGGIVALAPQQLPEMLGATVSYTE